MKKLALIMLAVVSMALVSCGGGNSDVKLADPAVTYKHSTLDSYVDISVKINSFDVKASGDDKNIIVSAKIELTDKDFRDIDYAYAKAQLLNENEEVVVESYREKLKIKKIGEVGLFSVEITPEKDLPASKTLNQVKYIRFADVYGYTWD